MSQLGGLRRSSGDVFLTHEPESIESAKARIGGAFVRLWDAEHMVATGAGERPGLTREHVFDFDDGIRLIISRDHYRKVDQTFLHVSGSCSSERVTAEKWTRPEQMIQPLMRRLSEISDLPQESVCNRPIVTPKGVLHFFFPLSVTKAAAKVGHN